jgi:hypothetical protein
MGRTDRKIRYSGMMSGHDGEGGVEPTPEELTQLLIQRPLLAKILACHPRDRIFIQNGAVIVSFSTDPDDPGELRVASSLIDRQPGED